MTEWGTFYYAIIKKPLFALADFGCKLRFFNDHFSIIIVIKKGLEVYCIVISSERMIVDIWLTPHFDQNKHVSISVSNILYLSDDRKCSEMPK